MNRSVDCCELYGSVFTSREAKRKARSFRRRGVTGTASAVVELLSRDGLDGATVLDVGAGVGALQIALLEAGAAEVAGIELSPSWEAAAADLLEERGLTGRAPRHVGDFIDAAPRLPEHDAVVMHRVICCHPDWTGMVDAGASRARRSLVLTFPEDAWWNRVAIGIGNAWMRLHRTPFRGFVHPPAAVIGRVAERGFPVVEDRRGRVWRTVLCTRPG